MTDWEPILMAALGAAAIQIDPSLPVVNMVILAIKAAIGAAVGAYFGNHLSGRKKKDEAKKEEL